MQRRVAARPLQFCWWPLADPLTVLRLRRVPVLLGSHEVPHRRMLPGPDSVWFMRVVIRVRSQISANVRTQILPQTPVSLNFDPVFGPNQNIQVVVTRFILDELDSLC